MKSLALLFSLFGLETWFDGGQPADIVPLARHDKLIDAIIQNINVPEGLRGLSIASPSRSSPDYYYHWVRDGALSMSAIVNEWVATGDPQLAQLIQDYASSVGVLQDGASRSAANLGEPKFFVDGSVFTGPWGRPQNDGPALRALVLSKWAAMSRVHHSTTVALKSLYSRAISRDAFYVSNVWSQPSFDLWEEQYGFHLFTSVAQWGALKAAAIIADSVGAKEDAAHFRRNREALGLMIVDRFFDDNGSLCEHWPCGSQGRSGLDTATVLAALELKDLAGWTTLVDNVPLLLNSTSPAILDTVHRLRKAGSNLYKVAGGIGRYPEDVYDGVGQSRGNPWFLCTAAAAQVLVESNHIRDAIEQLRFIGEHRAHDGTISEEADAVTGFMRGAQNLSWSYSSLYRVQKVAVAAGRPDLVRLTEPFNSY